MFCTRVYIKVLHKNLGSRVSQDVGCYGQQVGAFLCVYIIYIYVYIYIHILYIYMALKASDTCVVVKTRFGGLTIMAHIGNDMRYASE